MSDRNAERPPCQTMLTSTSSNLRSGIRSGEAHTSSRTTLDAGRQTPFPSNSGKQAISAYDAALSGRPDFPAAQRALARSTERPSRRGTAAPRHEALVPETNLAAGHGYRPQSGTCPVLQAQRVQKHAPGRSATAC